LIFSIIRLLLDRCLVCALAPDVALAFNLKYLIVRRIYSEWFQRCNRLSHALCRFPVEH